MNKLLILLFFIVAINCYGLELKPGPFIYGNPANPTTDVLFQLNSNSQAVLFPTLTTTERNNITVPVDGMIIYNSTVNKLQTYDGAATAWISLGIAGGGFTQGSVIFADATGVLDEDNANLFWDDTNDILRVGNGSADTTSIFETFSTTKGTRPCPSMTEVQRDAIGLPGSPATGLCIYNSTTDKLNVYNGTAWGAIGGGIDAWSSGVTYAVGDVIHESFKIYLANTAHTSGGTFAGDVANWDELSDDLNKETSVTNNAIVLWDGTGGDDVKDSSILVTGGNNIGGVVNFTYSGNLTTPLTPSRAVITDGTADLASSVTTSTELSYVSGVTSSIQAQIDGIFGGALPSANIFVGDATGDAQAVPMTGDIGIDNLGVTSIQVGVIVDADIDGSADIDATKLGTGIVDNTEFNLLDGRTYLPDVDGTSDYVAFFNGTNSLTGSPNFTFNSGVTAINGQLTVDSLRLNGNVLSSTTGNIELDPSGTGKVQFTSLGGGQTYQFYIDGTNPLSLQGLTPATNSQLHLFSNDGNTTDSVSISGFGFGLPGSTANSEAFFLGWNADTSKYELKTVIQGSGVARNFSLFTHGNTDQLELLTDGSTDINGNLNINGGNLLVIHDSSGDQTIGIKTPADLLANYILTLPPDDGDPSQVLQTDGSGILDWVDFPAGDSSNLLDDGGFETGVDNVTVTTGSKAEEITTVLYNDKSLKLTQTATALDAEQCIPSAKATQWVGKTLRVSCWVKSSVTDLVLNAWNGTSEDGTDDSYDGSDEWRYLSTAMSLDSGESACWKLTAGSTTDDTFVDQCFVGELEIDGTTIVHTSKIDYQAAQNTFQNLAADVQFPAGGVPVTKISGDEVIEVDNSGDPTKFICKKPQCQFTYSWSLRLDVSVWDVADTRKYNSLGSLQKTLQGSYTQTSGAGTIVAGTWHLEEGEYVTFGHSATTMTNSGALASLNITANYFEQKFISSTLSDVAGFDKNDCAVRISGTSIVSDSNSCVASVSNPVTGQYDLTFTSNYFSVIPSIVGMAENNNTTINSDSLTTSSATIRIYNTAGSLINQPFTLYFKKQGSDYVDKPKIVAEISAKKSIIRLHTDNGHGSTDTRIRRFANYELDRSGSFASLGGGSFTTFDGSITVNDTAANGTTFTINKSGNYAISYTDFRSTGASANGISLDSSELTTGINGITVADRLVSDSSVANTPNGVYWSGYLEAGEVIRAHVEDQHTASALVNFTISRTD